MTPSVGPDVTLFRMYVFALGIESCHPTVLSVITSGVHHSLERALQYVLNFSFHQQIAPCGRAHTSLRICIHLKH